jgi:hypothetical protein
VSRLAGVQVVLVSRIYAFKIPSAVEIRGIGIEEEIIVITIPVKSTSTRLS